MKKNIIITGANGYIGAMLIDQFLKRDDIGIIIGIDKDNYDELLNQLLNKTENKNRLFFINKNLADISWQDDVENICKNNNFKINNVIHTAWQIREMYNNQKTEWEWNITGSENVFNFAFDNNVEKLIYFSTVASYGAFADNKVDYYFTEEDEFRKSGYLYAEEKRIAEERLRNIFDKNKDKITSVIILRPAAISGPRGRYGRIRFGLQSALSGSLKKEKSIVYNIIALMTGFVPVTKKWLRQFIHEDDVNDLVQAVLFNSPKNKYNIYNICPPGETVRASDMAKAVNKKMIRIHPQLIRIVFGIFWHLTRGKVPTGSSAWKGYSYPIAVSGEKISRDYNYKYKYECKEVFVTNEGRYNYYVRG